MSAFASRTEEIALETGSIRGVALAGEGFSPRIAINLTHVYNTNEEGKRFTIGDEPCHVPFDRIRARRIAHVSGAWAAPGIERRANASNFVPRSAHGGEPRAADRREQGNTLTTPCEICKSRMGDREDATSSKSPGSGVRTKAIVAVDSMTAVSWKKPIHPCSRSEIFQEWKFHSGVLRAFATRMMVPARIGSDRHLRHLAGGRNRPIDHTPGRPPGRPRETRIVRSSEAPAPTHRRIVSPPHRRSTLRVQRRTGPSRFKTALVERAVRRRAPVRPSRTTAGVSSRPSRTGAPAPGWSNRPGKPGAVHQPAVRLAPRLRTPRGGNLTAGKIRPHPPAPAPAPTGAGTASAGTLKTPFARGYISPPSGSRWRMAAAYRRREAPLLHAHPACPH